MYGEHLRSIAIVYAVGWGFLNLIIVVIHMTLFHCNLSFVAV